MAKDILVIGLGTFGYALALKLYANGHKVMAIDKDEHLINQIKDDVTVALTADVTDVEVLERIDAPKFDCIILGTSSSLETAVLTLTHLKKLKVRKIITKANTMLQKEVLVKLGADEVILAENEIAQRLANRITHPNIKEIFTLDANISLVSVKVPKRMSGKPLKELDLRNKHNISVFIRKVAGKSEIISNPNIKFDEGDELFVAGEEADIYKIFG